MGRSMVWLRRDARRKGTAVARGRNADAETRASEVGLRTMVVRSLHRAVAVGALFLGCGLTSSGPARAADALVAVGDELSVGEDKTGETCKLRLAESRSDLGGYTRYSLFCEGWTLPSGEIRRFGISQGYTVEKMLTDSNWEKSYSTRLGACSNVEPTTLGVMAAPAGPRAAGGAGGAPARGGSVRGLGGAPPPRRGGFASPPPPHAPACAGGRRGGAGGHAPPRRCREAFRRSLRRHSARRDHGRLER